jgi:hypothetical protein
MIHACITDVYCTVRRGILLYKCAIRMHMIHKRKEKKRPYGTVEEWPWHNILYQGTTVLGLRWRLYQRAWNSRVVRVGSWSLSTNVERKWIALSDLLARASLSTTCSMVGRCSGSAAVIALTRSRTNSNPWYFYNVINILVNRGQATRTCMKFSRSRLPRQ